MTNAADALPWPVHDYDSLNSLMDSVEAEINALPGSSIVEETCATIALGFRSAFTELFSISSAHRAMHKGLAKRLQDQVDRALNVIPADSKYRENVESRRTEVRYFVSNAAQLQDNDSGISIDPTGSDVPLISFADQQSNNREHKAVLNVLNQKIGELSGEPNLRQADEIKTLIANLICRMKSDYGAACSVHGANLDQLVSLANRFIRMLNDNTTFNVRQSLIAALEDLENACCIFERSGPVDADVALL